MGRRKQQGTQEKKTKSRAGVRTRQVIIAAGIIGAVGAPVGFAATGGTLREGVRNGTATKETQIVGNFGSTTALTGGYVTRQSNLSSSGGGAVYGCRSGVGGSLANPPQNPCVRANNLAKGFAFEFNATSGDVVGTITSSSGGDTKKPFTTNATGVATGLNADRVDNLNGADIQKLVTDAAAAAAADATAKANASRDRWALVGANGTILKQSGGFTTVNCYQANANCYLDTGADATNRAVTAEILTTNGTNDAGTPIDPAVAGSGLTGETSAAPCGLDLVNCVPPGTENANVVVVAPRNSDGNPPTAAQTKYSFYVKVSAAPAG